MKRKRRKKKNPGAFWKFASEHPIATVFLGIFVLPTILYLPVAIIRAVRNKEGDNVVRSLAPPGGV